MAVDVSGITSALINNPAQQGASIQNTLEQAYQDKQRAEQNQFQNTILSQKAALDAAVKKGTMDLNSLKIASAQGDYVGSWAQGLLANKDPAQRGLMLQAGLAQADKMGLSPVVKQEMLQAAQDPNYATTLIARTMAVKDFYKGFLADSTGKDQSQAMKKYNDYITLAKTNGTYTPGTTEKVAEGLAFGSYKTNMDPTTGDVIITDLRSAGGNMRVNPQESSAIDALGGVPRPDTNYSPVRIATGNKMELRTQDKVQELSDKMVKANIPDMEAMIQPLEATIDSTYAKGKGLPGFGIGTSLIPDWAVDQRTKDFRQDVKKLFDTVLKIRSGSAVVQQELDRLKDEYGVGTFKTASQLVHAIHSARKVLELEKESVYAGYDPTITDRYWKQGGVKPIGAAPKAEAAPPAITADRIRADAKKYGWTEEQTNEAIKKYVKE